MWFIRENAIFFLFTGCQKKIGPDLLKECIVKMHEEQGSGFQHKLFAM